MFPYCLWLVSFFLWLGLINRCQRLFFSRFSFFVCLANFGKSFPRSHTFYIQIPTHTDTLTHRHTKLKNHLESKVAISGVFFSFVVKISPGASFGFVCLVHIHFTVDFSFFFYGLVWLVGLVEGRWKEWERWAVGWARCMVSVWYQLLRWCSWHRCHLCLLLSHRTRKIYKERERERESNKKWLSWAFTTFSVWLGTLSFEPFIHSLCLIVFLFPFLVILTWRSISDLPPVLSVTEVP